MNARFLRWTAIGIFFGTCVIQVPAAQEKTPPGDKNGNQPFKLTVGANLVIVPVIVTDKHGEHVSGLKAEDFEVKEEGKVQKIVRFDELTAETSQIQRPAATGKTFTNEVVAEHPKKLEIIALDQVNTPFTSRREGDRALVEFLAKNVDANTLLALVALEPNGPYIIHDFTADPSTLVEAVKKLHTSLNAKDTLTLDNLGDNSQADLEALQLAAVLNGANPGDVSTPQQLGAVARGQRAQVDLSRQAQEGLITLENFQMLAQYFAGVPGRKSLIWASTGFPFSLGAGAQSVTRGTTDDDWRRTFDMLTDANIAVYPVDIGGLLPGVNANTIQSVNSAAIRANSPEGGVGIRSGQLASMENGSFVDPTVGRHQTMNSLAETTGGQTFYNANDASELFRRASQDTAQYYMLAYYAKDSGKYGWRNLSVKVDRKDLKVRARSGFLFADSRKKADRNALLKDLKIALSSDLSFTSIPLKGEWEQTEQAGKQKKVHFVLSIPAGVASIDTENKNHISLEFLIEATDSAGKNVANVSQRFDTNLPDSSVAQLQTKGVGYGNALTLSPGKYTVHFVVRDNIRSTMGSLVTQLTVE